MNIKLEVLERGRVNTQRATSAHRDRRTSEADLVGAEKNPAELPGLCRCLGLGQPLLGHILMLHVWIKIQLVERLEADTRANPQSASFGF